eukprot:scaffold12596_cov34-Phaeocystis_antarctica.AAC.1
MRVGGRGEQVAAPFWSHCTARRREDDTIASKLGGRAKEWGGNVRVLARAVFGAYGCTVCTHSRTLHS